MTDATAFPSIAALRGALATGPRGWRACPGAAAGPVRRVVCAALVAVALVGGIGCRTSEPAEEDAASGTPSAGSEFAPVPGLPANQPPDVLHLPVAEGETPPDAVPFAWVDRNVVTVGDVITLEVAVNHAVGVQVAFPTFRRMNRFEVLPGGDVDAQPTTDGRIVSRRKYLLQAFMPGDYRIPAVPLTYLDRDGRNRRLRTEPIQVVAASVIPEGAEPTDVVDIKPPKAGGIPLPLWLLPAAIAVVVSVAALLTFLIFRLRRRAPVLDRPLLPHELALKELQALEERKLLAERRFQEHYVELSLIFRRYLARRYGWSALVRTSEEIERTLADAPHLGEHTYEVADRFMGGTDKVKFAAHEPTPPESDGTWHDIGYFIDLTRTVVPTVELEGEAPGEPEA
ncbi:MAG: BatD family protein [bacterium]